jgi:hypothetical protein
VTITVWEAIFMLVVLKIPLVYLGAVVWWAVRAEPGPTGEGEEIGVPVPLTPCGWDEWRRRRALRPPRPPFRPAGRPFRTARASTR